MKKWICFLAIMLTSSVCFAADYEIEERTVYKIISVNKVLECEAGEKLADFPSLINYINKTVSEGYKVRFRINIRASVEKLQ